MKKEKTKLKSASFIIFLLMSSLFFTQIAQANWGDSSFEKLIADSNWRGVFIGVYYRFILPSLVRFFDYLEQIILTNPPINHALIHDPLIFFITILEPVYIISILFLGFYLILMSGSPSGRAKAKSLLPRLIISMILVTTSPFILEIVLETSHNFAQDILVLNPAKGYNYYLVTFNYLSMEFAYKGALNLDISHLILIAGFLMVFGIYLSITLRYILLTMFIIVFPIGIFLYFFNTTKNFGRKMIEQMFIWSFAQGVSALIYVLTTLGIIFLGFTGRAIVIPGLVASFLFMISPFILFLLVRRFLP